MKFFLLFNIFSFLVSGKIISLSEDDFQLSLASDPKIPKMVVFYLEYCVAYANLQSTFEALAENIGGDSYKFFSVNIEKYPEIGNLMGIFESPTFAIIEYNEVYFYAGSLNNYDSLLEFLGNYKETGNHYELPKKVSRLKNLLKYVHGKLDMFRLLYIYNVQQFYALIVLTLLQVVAVFWTWKLLDEHIDILKRKEKSQ